MPTRPRRPAVRGKEPQELSDPLRPRRRLVRGPRMVTTSITLPEALHRDLQRVAGERNWSFAAVLHDAAVYWLARHIATLDRAARTRHTTRRRR